MSFFFRVAVVSLAALGSCTPRPAQFVSSGIVSDGREDAQGRIWFEFSRIDQRFVVDHSLDPEAIFAILKDSSNSGRSVTVRYDADSGHFDGHAGKAIYVARSLTYKSSTVVAEPFDLFAGVTWPWKQTDRAEAALARGIGLYNLSDYSGAHRVLEPEIRNGALSSSLRRLALDTDGRALYYDAFIQMRPGEERDRQFIAALSDFRAWKKLAPKDSDPELQIAEALADLGAYDEALATLRRIADTWPKERFWALVHAGAVYRTIGKPESALAALDELVERDGPQNGMAYHYHRGWTLSELGRYAEAEQEFSRGIADQPDYAWAFIRRACARASLGRLHDAAADQQAAAALAEADIKSNPQGDTDVYRRDRARMRSVLGTLRAAVATGEPTKIDGLCNGYSDFGESRRARSSLLQ